MQAEGLYQPYVSEYQRAMFRQYTPDDPSMMFESPAYALDFGFRDWEFGNVAPDFGPYASDVRAISGTTGGPVVRPATNYQYTYQEPGEEAETRTGRKYVADPDAAAYYESEEFLGYAPEVRQQIRQYASGRETTLANMAKSGRKIAAPYYANQYLSSPEYLSLPEGLQRNIADTYSKNVPKGKGLPAGMVGSFISQDAADQWAMWYMAQDDKRKAGQDHVMFGDDLLIQAMNDLSDTIEAQAAGFPTYEEFLQALAPNPLSHPLLPSSEYGKAAEDTPARRESYERKTLQAKLQAGNQLRKEVFKQAGVLSNYGKPTSTASGGVNFLKNQYEPGTWDHWFHWFMTGQE